ncbi:MAG: ligase-associated DNA damage response endonuclease PdeM [Gemmatimonadaceae bacterium]
MTATEPRPPARELAMDVAGERVVLRGDRSLFWPRRRWLIVADLHVGKVQSLRRDGVALPDAVLTDDLQRLSRAVRASGAERLLVLGDLVHDAHGLTPALVEMVAAWRAALGTPISLVPGNHDQRVPALPDAWAIEQLSEVVDEGVFRFSHDLSPGAAFNWHGHIHPAVTLRGGVDRLRFPCFVVDDGEGILPAFSALTGGDATPRATTARHFPVVDDHVIALPTR